MVEFLKGYLELKPAGKNLKAICPFHSEKTPSFIVSPERGIWHCFGCGEGGDIFRFLMKYENLEFYEAMKILAEKAGIELRKLSPADQKQFGILYDLNNAAKEFFKESLKISDKAKSYLDGRGLTKEIIEEFEVGYAPQGFDELTLRLINKGFEMDDIVRAGLIIRTDTGKYMDRFRGRIMFPIHNSFGKTVGFSGRILPEFESDDFGKYINSPETPIFNKSRLLYGFWKTKSFIRETGTALLVEGQMDFLMSYQDGVRNVVATSGTALTQDHLKTLRRLADKLILGFDNDEAGLLAAERSIDLAGANDFNVFVMPFGGENKDPAEIVQKTPGALVGLISSAKRALDHYIERYLKGKNIYEQKENVRVILNKIRNLWSPIEQSYWLRELAYVTGVPEKQLTEEMAKLPLSSENRAETQALADESKKATKAELIARRLLSLVNLQTRFKGEMEPYLDFMPGKYRLVYESLGIKKVTDPEIKELLDMVSLAYSETLPIEEKIDLEFQTLLKALELEHLDRLKEEISRQILEAEKLDNDDELLTKLREFDDISRKIQYIKNGKKS